MPSLGLGLGLHRSTLLARGLLDDYSGAAAAYSLRKLRAGVTSVVRVRRSSDNAEADFTAGEAANGTLTGWVGAGDGFVVTWYDQSGNGNDATQATAASQPKIVDTGTYLGEVDFDGTDDNLQLSGSGLDIFKNVGYGHVFMVAKPDETGTSGKRYFEATTSGLDARLLIGDSPASAGHARIGARRLDADSFVSITSASGHGNAETIITGFVDWASSDAYLYFNGSLIASSTSFLTDGNTENTTSSKVSIGGQSGALSSNFKAKEVIVYNTDQSSNRTAIEANINNQYSIY